MRVGHKITELSTWCLYRVLAIRQTLLYLCLFVGCVTVDAQERPRVVRTSPENGAMSVDPATNELRVTFDQPMATGVSFVGGGPTAPEVVGRPQWLSNTTIVLPIRLKPDHAYWLSINSDRYQNFRGINRLPAVPYPISFRTAPSWVAFTPDGDPFKGKGLSPDIHVAFPGEAMDEDPLINAALDFLLARPDFSGDGRVDFADFLLFVQRFGLNRSDEGYDARYDLDSDGTIGFGDFLIFASAFGN